MLSCSLPHRLHCCIPFALLLLCIAGDALHAGGWPQPEGRLFLKAYGGASTAGSYYDRDGELVADASVELTQPGDTVRTFVAITNEFDGILGGLYGEYGLTPDLTLLLDVPVGHFELRRRGQYSEQGADNSIKTYRIDTLYSITSPVYYGLGARYRIAASERMQTSLVAMLHVPPGFSSPIRNNPDYPFLSDGAFEVRAGFELGIPASFGWAAFHALYNWRDEELKDEARIHAELGFNRVENATIKFHIDIVQSLSSFDGVEFIPRETLLQENYIAAGASFALFFSKQWFVDVDYSVRIFGANTWNLSNVVVGTGLVLDGI